MTIQYFDALAGAGKTRALVGYAKQLAHLGEHVLFAQPSRLLIDNTIVNEIGSVPATYKVSALHSGTTREVVKSIVQNTQADTGSKGEILFVTHEAFMQLPYIENKRNWHLLFDETPTIDLFEAINVPETHRIITDLIEIRAHDAAYGRLLPKDNAELAKLAKNKRSDAVWRIFGDLANRITSPHWEVYALNSNFQSLLRDDGGCTQFITYSLLQPSIFQGFKQTIIASALFRSSVLYQLWTAQGVRLKAVDPAMSASLRYQAHENGPHVTINYLTDADWSKSLRDKRMNSCDEKESGSLRDVLPSLIVSAMNEKAFAWMGNKDIPDDYFRSTNAIRLPNSPHGLNSFQHLHNVVVLSALNPPPAHFHFMDARGVDAEALRTAHYRSAVYQAVMRISVRDPVNTTPKTIVVMDRSTAYWLADLFPGASVQPLGGAVVKVDTAKRGRPRKHASGIDRNRAYRERKRALKAGTIPLTNAGDFGTAYSSIYERDPLLHLDVEDDNAFIALLRDLYRRKLPSKDANFLFSPAHFDANAPGADTRRGLSNVKHVRGIWLDNDGGDLSPEEFARLFPTLRIVAWNTYSSTTETPRWRCFIPTTQAVSANVYQAIIEQIMQVLRYAGYVSDIEKAKRPNLKVHGFDTSKFVASSLFYAPCQAAEARSSFFQDYNEPDRDTIDSDLWIENDIRSIALPVHELTQERKGVISGDKAQAIQEATERWRRTPRGQGNRAFYRLAQDLLRAGLSKTEVRVRLDIEAAYAASPRDRAAEAKRLTRRMR